MENDIHFYRCQTCGNLLHLLHEGGGRLVCCGSQMVDLEPKEGGMAAESHLPVITKENGLLTVKIGASTHPSEPHHHIEWIALVTPWRTTIRYLKSDEEPTAVFSDVPHGTIFSYCSLHYLWKKTF